LRTVAYNFTRGPDKDNWIVTVDLMLPITHIILAIQ